MISLIQFITVTVLSLVIALVTAEPFDAAKLTGCLPEILYLGIASSGVAYTLQIIGQKGTHPAVASIILSLESVVGAVASAIIIGEFLTPREYTGCAIVFVAIVVSQLDFSAFSPKKVKKEADITAE